MRIKAIIFLLSLTSLVTADNISLYDWGFYENGNIKSNPSELPDYVTWTDNFWESGLGTLTIAFNDGVAPEKNIAMFFDYQITSINNPYTNEYGLIVGVPNDPRLEFEIDEPGYGNGYYTGDIYDNFTCFNTYRLDGESFYDSFTGDYLTNYQDPISDDVSMALGWNFALNDNETAVLEYTITNVAPSSGFYLAQLDRDSPETGIYLQSRLSVKSTNVPEPNILSLFGMGLVSLCVLNRSRKKII